MHRVIIILMLRRFSYSFAYLLLVLMPLQAIAGANMLVCNSMTQAHTQSSLQTQTQTQTQTQDQILLTDAMPCHQKIDSVITEKSSTYPCKASCASECANMGAVIALTAPMQLSFELNTNHDFSFNNFSYASITQPNLQRPPITFI